MNVVYMGTPEFAVPSLQAIINAGHRVSGVFTQPDKKVGRKQVLTPPPVKVCALDNKIPVYQPGTLKDAGAQNVLEELSPDVIVVVAYGKILPKAVLDLPKYGCINVHASLLPKYRGAGPIQWAVINGEKKTGVTTMYMAEGLDTGDMLKKAEIAIGENDTTAQMHDKLSSLGAQLIIQTLSDTEAKKLTPTVQKSELSTYAPMLDKSLCPINWKETAQNIHNQVRGLNPWPVATTKVNGKKLKLYSTLLTVGKGEPGEVISLDPLVVACGKNAVQILEIQPEGKKRMSGEEFVRGYRLTTETRFS